MYTHIEDVQQALEEMLDRRCKRYERLHYYKCTFCTLYHIGNMRDLP